MSGPHVDWLSAAWGLGCIGSGVYFVWKREVPYGIRRRPPMGVARGRPAVVIGLLAIIGGLYVLVSR